MNTHQLLDLFHYEPVEQRADTAPTEALGNFAKPPGGIQSVLEGLDELWEEEQYAEEFSLSKYLNSVQ
jgi:TATA-binding protein-associated factor